MACTQLGHCLVASNSSGNPERSPTVNSFKLLEIFQDYQKNLMPPNNGLIAYMPSETKVNVDHAGLLLLLKFYPIDSVLLLKEKLT
jgi:hypothetical protein